MTETTSSGKPALLVVDDLIPSSCGSSGDKDLLSLCSALSELPYQLVFAHTRNHVDLEYQRQSQEELYKAGVDMVASLAAAEELKEFVSAVGGRTEFVWIRRASNFQPFYRLKQEGVWSPLLIIDFVDLHFLRFKRSAFYLDSCQDMLSMALASFEMETFALSHADTAVCISRFEESILLGLEPEQRVCFVPISRDINQCEPVKSNEDSRKGSIALGFIGSFEHAPNLTSINHFLSSIFPDLVAKFPHLTLVIAGRGSTPSQISPAVSCIGEVKSLDEFYSQIDIAIAPLLFGAGQKGKVVEALAYGKPMVASSIAAEGFEDDLLNLIVVADSKDDYLNYLEQFDVSGVHKDSQSMFASASKLLAPSRFKALTREVVLGLARRPPNSNFGSLQARPDFSCGPVRRIGFSGHSQRPMYSLVSQADYISNCLARDGFFDQALNHLIRVLGCDLAPNSLVVDVGANVGSFAIPMALVRPDLEVIAFEPQLTPYCQLCSSIIDNSAHNINPVRAVVAESSVSQLIDIPVLDSLNSANLGGFSIDPDIFNWKLDCGEIRVDDDVRHTVQLLSLDGFRSQGLLRGSVGMIKISVEGAECSVLKGARQLIQECMPVLIYKRWNSDYAAQFQSKGQEADTFVAGFGYRIVRFGEIRVAIPKLI